MWEYIGQALELCMPSAVFWVHVVRGWLLYTSTRRPGESSSTSSANRAASRWKRRHKRGIWTKINKRITCACTAAITSIDKATTWIIGNEPTNKERMTWTSPKFSIQKRIRVDRSTGQGYNKRRIGTSAWFRTAATVCLIASTTGKTHARSFDSDSVTIHVYNCASRCITNSLHDFIRPPKR